MRTIFALAAVFSLFVMLLFLGTGGRTDATSLSPTGSVTLSDSTPSANANIVISYAVDSPHARESDHLSFIPPEFGVAADIDVPDGAKVGTLSVGTTESSSNGPCSSSSTIVYDLFEATTNTTTLLGDNPRIPDPGWPGFADTNPVNGLPDAIDKYPTFLSNLYPGLTPRARAYGFADAAIAGINRVFNVLVFDPGTTLPGLSPLDPSLGYIVVIVAQDPTAPALPSTVSEDCSPYQFNRVDRGKTLDNIDTPASEANFVNRTNPAVDGTYTFMDYGSTIRDLDNDGIENSLDTCFPDATPDWNPRVSDAINDPDGDGIPGKDDPGILGEQLLAGSGCDVTPLTADSDVDGDGFENRQDNCPLVANGAAGDNQADADGDGIGDTCDALLNVPDGHVHEVCLTADVVVGTGGTPPSLACPDLIPDEDNDGFANDVELNVGTDPHVSCGGSGWPADLYIDPPSDNKVTLQDLTSFLAPVRYLDSDIGGIPGNVRWDLVPGKGPFSSDINIQDLTTLIAFTAPMLDGARAFDGPPCPYP